MHQGNGLEIHTLRDFLVHIFDECIDHNICNLTHKIIKTLALKTLQNQDCAFALGTIQYH